ncbi:MAG: alanine racemase [Deltaproteobacteria bacterium]|nr:alanine racemase [Deltaproteobacteria bacterium]
MEKRPTSAYINTEALKFNYFNLKEQVPENTKFMAIVKANAYGHGDVEVARVLQSLGCEYLAVAIPEEGVRLRLGGIKTPIVILGGVYPGQLGEIFDLDLTPVVFDINTARLLDVFAKRAGVEKKVHVKIDTGMGRLGLLPGQVEGFFKEFKSLSNLKLEAVLSHFSESESPDRSFSQAQIRLFRKAVEEIRALGIAPGFIDMANSAGAVNLKDSCFDLIRPGIMLYGSYPAPHLRDKITLRPVMELKTRILQLKDLGPKQPVSYGRRFVTKRDSTIAVLPIGYADGLPRRLTGAGEVLIRGRRAPIAGTVCMDLTMADVTGIPGVAVGDEAVIIGKQGGEVITAEEIAEKVGTISYEIFCNISPRVPRIYV